MSRTDTTREQDEIILEALRRFEAGETAAALSREYWPNREPAYARALFGRILKECKV